jgi:thioredoxin reductase
VAWVEPSDVTLVARQANGFAVELANEERFTARRIVIATGLSGFDHMPRVVSALLPDLVTHTSRIGNFADYRGRNVAVIGAGQSALEAAALLHEAGARPQLLVRKQKIAWHHRISKKRSIWRRLRSPISGLGSGPTAWALTHLPGAVHRMPVALRARFVKDHLPAEGAWWLRDRVENRVPIHLGTTVVGASETAGRVSLRLYDTKTDNERSLVVDHVIAGTGYVIDVDRLGFLDRGLRGAIRRHERAPALNTAFETSVRGLHIIGPASSSSFGPLFRFVVGAHYTAGTVSAGLAVQSQCAS